MFPIKTLTTVLITFFMVFNIAAQEISVNLSVFGYQKEPRETLHRYYSIGSNGQFGFSYSDTLSGRLDYKVGLSYSFFQESYYSNIEIAGDTIGGEVNSFTRRISDRYLSYNASLNIGVALWLQNKRKGFYVPIELLSIFMMQASLQEYKYDENNRFLLYNSDAIDSYNKVNFVFRTGVGYKFIVYKGLSISAAYNLVFRFRDVIEGVEDSLVFNRGIMLVGGFKF